MSWNKLIYNIFNSTSSKSLSIAISTRPFSLSCEIEDRKYDFKNFRLKKLQSGRCNKDMNSQSNSISNCCIWEASKRFFKL